ncbi:hypothetical protein SGPA1_20816 [Streptomyces misionensis JCM 4497]
MRRAGTRAPRRRVRPRTGAGRGRRPLDGRHRRRLTGRRGDRVLGLRPGVRAVAGRARHRDRPARLAAGGRRSGPRCPRAARSRARDGRPPSAESAGHECVGPRSAASGRRRDRLAVGGVAAADQRRRVRRAGRPGPRHRAFGADRGERRGSDGLVEGRPPRGTAGARGGARLRRFATAAGPRALLVRLRGRPHPARRRPWLVDGGPHRRHRLRPPRRRAGRGVAGRPGPRVARTAGGARQTGRTALVSRYGGQLPVRQAQRPSSLRVTLRSLRRWEGSSAR